MGTPRDRTRVSDDAILVAVVRVSRRRGPAFTLAEVGREVGLSAARLVQRFGSRRGLILAAMRYWGAMSLSVVETLGKAARPLDAYLRLIQASASSYRTMRPADSFAWFFLATSEPQLHRWYRDYLGRLEDATAELLEAAVAAGELRSLDTATMASRLTAVQLGRMALASVRGEPNGVAAVVADAVADMVELLAPYSRSNLIVR
ncbi:MAG: hypothetical protein JNJ80_09480 [Gemmatimonadetes bacterium]|nr:hypothetical protein [Gemmatimonadota bacterium]